MTTLRASGLPRIARCPGSKIHPQVLIGDDHPLANTGTAVHQVCAEAIAEGLETPGDLEPYLHAHGLTDFIDFKILCWQALNVWRPIWDSLRPIAIEESFERELMPGFSITGHPDILCETVDEKYLVVVDFKTGYKRSDYDDQLMAYLWLAWEKFPEYEMGKTIVIWCRDEETEIQNVSKAGVDGWEGRMRVKLQSDDIIPGEQCAFCPRWHECKQGHEFTRTAARVFDTFKAEAKNTPPTASDLALLWPLRCVLNSALAKYSTMAKALITQEGPQPTGDGKLLGIWEKEFEKIDAAKAIRAMSDILKHKPGTDEVVRNIPGLFKISTTDFKNAVRVNTKSGKGAAVEKAMEQLRAVQGTYKEKHRELRAQKPKK